ncbi:hypothetical protein [Haloarcula amylolytica]|uniref:Uncharacterized protein n=1 Tax=Haloarcula amylolytica JCM 13557 TaxID=1227452 RepID=M0KSD9_9EURY|nr:hypothetical protein [Haloarcula amylolytica]EMA23114.1 hypothetical protein C442_08811 [Haloarcula amylolytica JCM 13557]
MAGLSATSGGGFDYIQSAEPADPENGELWFDTDGGTDGNGEVKVYDGTTWDTTGYVSHDQLTNVSPGDHFTPGSGLSFNSGTLALLLSSYLTIDGNGDLALASDSIGQDRLAFNTATQSELNGHAGDSTAHHSKPSGTQNTTDEVWRDLGYSNKVFSVVTGYEIEVDHYGGDTGKTGQHEFRLYDRKDGKIIHTETFTTENTGQYEYVSGSVPDVWAGYYEFNFEYETNWQNGAIRIAPTPQHSHNI